MKDDILINLNDPHKLEKIYRTNKGHFKQEFTNIYPKVKGDAIAECWYERLNYENEDINWGTGRELFFVIIAAVVAGLLAKLPAVLSISEEFFYSRNIGFIIFPALMAYFSWKNKLSTGKIFFIAGAIIVSAIFINSLPDVQESDTLILSCMHLLLFLWSILGFAFVSEVPNNDERRLGFLKYNGDLVVMSALILIAGGIMTGLTIGLFELIGFQIEKFYFEYIVIFGLPAVPIFATYLTQTNPNLVGKVSPVIAKIFSPLVLVMLVIYLIAMVSSGKDPYNDREFLLIFNVLLIGVMAIIFFSVAGTPKVNKSHTEIFILLLLSVVTVIVNGIALSAILFRISEWGITPNRAAVLGANILILINLLMVTAQLLKVSSKKDDIAVVGKSIAFYLPVYFLWAIVVTFIFPLIFGFK
ncbi:MAG: hypothetical protein ACNS60_15045 [Candidatus Cyclobacteriaceae bacterium M2_1C_046]